MRQHIEALLGRIAIRPFCYYQILSLLNIVIPANAGTNGAKALANARQIHR